MSFRVNMLGPAILENVSLLNGTFPFSLIQASVTQLHNLILEFKMMCVTPSLVWMHDKVPTVLNSHHQSSHSPFIAKAETNPLEPVQVC